MRAGSIRTGDLAPPAYSLVSPAPARAVTLSCAGLATGLTTTHISIVSGFYTFHSFAAGASAPRWWPSAAPWGAPWRTHLFVRRGSPLPLPTNASRACNARAWDRDLSRIAFPFYTFIKATDDSTDRWAKRLVRDGMRYKDSIIFAAATIVRRVRDVAARTGGSFASAHVRRGNLKHSDQISNARTFEAIVDATQSKVAGTGRPLYLATDVRNEFFFAPLHQAGLTIFTLSNFTDVLAAHGLRTELHGGMVEQLVAAQSEEFVGTDTSTTTSYIVRLRGYLGRGETSSRVATLRRSVERLREHAQPRPPFWDREWPVAWKDIDARACDEPPLLPAFCHGCQSQLQRRWIRLGVGVALSQRLGPATCASLVASNQSAARAVGVPADVAGCSCGFAAGESLCNEAIAAGRAGVRTGVSDLIGRR